MSSRTKPSTKPATKHSETATTSSTAGKPQSLQEFKDSVLSDLPPRPVVVYKFRKREHLHRTMTDPAFKPKVPVGRDLSPTEKKEVTQTVKAGITSGEVLHSGELNVPPQPKTKKEILPQLLNVCIPMGHLRFNIRSVPNLLRAPINTLTRFYLGNIHVQLVKKTNTRVLVVAFDEHNGLVSLTPLQVTQVQCKLIEL